MTKAEKSVLEILRLNAASGVVTGGPTGRPHRAAPIKERHIESCHKIRLCKRNKINSVFIATTYFVSATDVRKCTAN